MVFAVAVRALARRQRASELIEVRAINSVALLSRRSCIAAGRNHGAATALVCSLRWEGQTVRWKISHGGHDPRRIDLLAIVALLILIVGACRLFGAGFDKPGTTAFIVPSQSVRW